MCLLRVTSHARKVLIIRDETVCPSPLSWQLQMSYVKMTGSCFLQRSSTPSHQLCMGCALSYSTSQYLQKVRNRPQEMEITNEENVMGHLGIFINELYKLRICNCIHSLAVLISVMLITAAAGHLIGHKWEQNQTRGEQNVTVLQDALPITGFHLLSSTRNEKLGPLSWENRCWTKSWLSPQWSLRKTSGWDAKAPEDSFGRQGAWMCQLTRDAREGNVIRGDGKGEKGAISQSNLWGRMEPCPLDKSTYVRGGRHMFLICLGVPTWCTFLGYSTYKNTSKLPSVGEHG